MADSLLYQERTRQCELQSSEEQTAKCQRLQVLNHNKYRAITSKLRETVVTCTHESQILVVIDTTLKAHRAQKRADAIVDLTDSPMPAPPPPITNTKGLVPPSPQVKEKNHPPLAAASTPDKSSTETTTTVKTYKWSHLPTAKLNTHIHDAAFLKTIATEYAGASTDIPLTCTYDNNPQATLTAALSILGTTLPAEVLQKMFKYNPTESGKTLAAILKENNADRHLRHKDYNTAVANKNLTPGLEALFRGYSGPNFGDTDGDTKGFNNSHLILCQIDCKAPKTTPVGTVSPSHEHSNNMPRLHRWWTNQTRLGIRNQTPRFL
jgi:hypothetical protein